MINHLATVTKTFTIKYIKKTIYTHIQIIYNKNCNIHGITTLSGYSLLYYFLSFFPSLRDVAHCKYIKIINIVVLS